MSTEFHHEKLAQESLRKLELCTWLAQYETAAHTIQPLFPRYLFAQADLDDDLWRQIYRSPGVVTILGTRHERPTRLPRGEIEAIWVQCAADGVIHLPVVVPHEPIKRGDKVKVISGPYVKRFADFTGCCRWSAAARVALLLRSLDGHEIKLTLPRADVVAV